MYHPYPPRVGTRTNAKVGRTRSGSATRQARGGSTHHLRSTAHVATVAQMGNITFRSGQKLNWDKAAGKFTDESINEKYMMKEYHNGYKLPMV